MPTTPKANLITIAEMITDGLICPHKVDDVIDCATQNQALSGPVTNRLAELLQQAAMFDIGIRAELSVAARRGETGSYYSVERSMVVGVLLGMMLVFEITEVVPLLEMVQ